MIGPGDNLMAHETPLHVTPGGGVAAIELRRLAARRGQLLQYLTITWNSVECLVALIAC
jgi:hypothetical protein